MKILTLNSLCLSCSLLLVQTFSLGSHPDWTIQLGLDLLVDLGEVPGWARPQLHLQLATSLLGLTEGPAGEPVDALEANPGAKTTVRVWNIETIIILSWQQLPLRLTNFGRENLISGSNLVVISTLKKNNSKSLTIDRL